MWRPSIQLINHRFAWHNRRVVWQPARTRTRLLGALFLKLVLVRTTLTRLLLGYACIANLLDSLEPDHLVPEDDSFKTLLVQRLLLP